MKAEAYRPYWLKTRKDVTNVLKERLDTRLQNRLSGVQRGGLKSKESRLKKTRYLKSTGAIKGKINKQLEMSWP